MIGFVIRLAATGAAFVVAAWLLPQLDFPATRLADPVPDVVQLGLVALVFGLVNGLIKPVAKALSFPVRLMTLGLFSIVINAALLLLVAWIADQVKIDFTVGGFPPKLTADTVVGAVLGSIVISLVGALTGLVTKD